MAKASITQPRCSVCRSDDRLSVESALATGAAVKATARRFGLGHMAVTRHFENHVSDTWKAAMKMGPYASREELEKLCIDQGLRVVDGLRSLYASHHATLVATRETGSTLAYLATAREMRATLNDIGRITGELLPSVASVSVTNNFNSVTYLAGLGEDLALEFADAPEVLTRLHRVLQRRMTAALPPPGDLIEGEARAA